MGKGSQEEKPDEGSVEESKDLLESPARRVIREEDFGPPPPPDGGWGWVVVAASFLCNMVLDGIGYSFGILLEPLMKHFNEGKGMISMVNIVVTELAVIITKCCLGWEHPGRSDHVGGAHILHLGGQVRSQEHLHRWSRGLCCLHLHIDVLCQCLHADGVLRRPWGPGLGPDVRACCDGCGLLV